MQRIATRDWATDVDLAPFYWETKRLNFHKHIADSGTRKPALEPLWNLNSFYLPLPLRGSVCTTVQDAAGILWLLKSGGGEDSEQGWQCGTPDSQGALGDGLTLRAELITSV